MTISSKTQRTVRRLSADAKTATATAVSGGEMLQAAGDVITARMEIMAAGMTDPSKVDLKEMSLMSSEKVQALSESGAAVARTFGAIGQRLGANAVTEMGLASHAASVMAAAKDPAAAAMAQYSYAVGWWGRAVGQALTLNTELLKAQTDALRPIHKTAVANAKRLKK